MCQTKWLTKYLIETYEGLNPMNLDQLITQQAQELARLNAEKARQDAEKARQEAKAQNSTLLVIKTLEQYLDNIIKVGKLDPEFFANAFSAVMNKYSQVFTSETCETLFVATVVKLLTHPLYGVELRGHRPGNGGLIWAGKEFKNPHELFNHILSMTFPEASILGAVEGTFLGSEAWFNELLAMIFDPTEDPTYLPAEVRLGRFKDTVVAKLRKINELDAQPLELPNLDDLTADDAMYLEAMLGY